MMKLKKKHLVLDATTAFSGFESLAHVQTNMYRRFDHVTVGIQLKGSEAHAHVLSFTLLDNHPWKGEGGGEERSVNFLREARLEQKESSEEEEMVEEVKRKRTKPKINAYEFFEQMRKIGVRPIDSDKHDEQKES
jgi:hypothetical protein